MGFAARRNIRSNDKEIRLAPPQGPPGERKAIGIDLGTCFARVGIWKDGDVTIIPNDRGRLATPSCVAFSESGVLVGESALEQCDQNVENTIQSPQRLIGSKLGNPWVQWYMKMWPGKVTESEAGDVLIRVRGIGDATSAEMLVRPEDILSHLLDYLRRVAEGYLSTRVTDVVITVPSKFGLRQRAALTEACKLARLNPLELIKAPTAAAMAYFLTNPTQGRRYCLVCDLGGTYFDFALLTCDSGKVCEEAVGSDFVDFDGHMLRHCMADLKERLGKDIEHDKVAQQRLRRACEAAKRKLSQHARVNIFVQNITDGFDYELEVSRGQFEDICESDVDPLLDPVAWCLEECGLSRQGVDDIVLVGGAARIPRIRRAIREFFYCQTPQEVIRPDNAGVLGSAAYAELALGRILGSVPADLEHVELIQTSPFTLLPSDCNVQETISARPDHGKFEDSDAPTVQAEPSSPSTSAESATGVAEVGGSTSDVSNILDGQQRRDCDETFAKALRHSGANTRMDTSIPFAQGDATSPDHKFPSVARSAFNVASRGVEDSRGEASPRQTATPPVAWSPPVVEARSLPTGASTFSADQSGGPRIGRSDLRGSAARSAGVRPVLPSGGVTTLAPGDIQTGLRSENEFPSDEGAFGPRNRGLSPVQCRSPRMPVTAVGRGARSPQRNHANGAAVGIGRGFPRPASRPKLSAATVSRTTSSASGAASTPSNMFSPRIPDFGSWFRSLSPPVPTRSGQSDRCGSALMAGSGSAPTSGPFNAVGAWFRSLTPEDHMRARGASDRPQAQEDWSFWGCTRGRT